MRKFLAERLNRLRFDQGTMIALTAIIAGSAVVQTLAVREQAQLFREAQGWERERDRARVEVTLETISVSQGEVANGTWPRRMFWAVKATNASPFDVSMVHCDFELDAAAPTPVGNSNGGQVWEVPPSEYRGLFPSASRPTRLRHGEIAWFVYDEEEILGLVELFPGPVQVRPKCVDSLGNEHLASTWVPAEKTPLWATTSQRDPSDQ